MPRASAHTPSEVEQLKQMSRWRLLLTNTKFQEDLNELKLRVPVPCRDERALSFNSTWDFSYTSLVKVLEDRSIPPLSTETIKLYESLFERVYFSEGLTIWDAYEPIEADERGVRYAWEPPPSELGQRFILYVDLSKANLDLALRLIEEGLRQAVSARRAEKSLRNTSGVEGQQKQKRDRLDKLDFQLRVFDMAHDFFKKKGGKTLTYVAKNLQTNPSTVKSAYWVACYKIGVEGRKERSSVPDPGPFDRCRDPKCRAAQSGNSFTLTIKGLCKDHQAFLLMAEPKLRETLRADLSPIEHARARRHTGRSKGNRTSQIEE